MRTVADPDTDAAVYERHRDELIRYATALVGRDDAPDVLSNVMVRILKRHHLSDFDDPRAYLYRSVLNEARSLMRHRAVAQRAQQAITTDDGGSPEPAIDPAILRAVADLPARQRAATYLTYWMDCTSVEVATLMHARPATVRRYLHLARQRLRSVLDELPD